MCFRHPPRKLLGFIVSNRGIEANPAKIRALSQLATPTDLKQVQKLTGCMAALSRFISRLGEKALPLYRLFRRTEHFEWTDAATAGLVEIKALLAKQPNPGRTKRRQTHVIIHIGNTSGGERHARR